MAKPSAWATGCGQGHLQGWIPTIRLPVGVTDYDRGRLQASRLRPWPPARRSPVGTVPTRPLGCRPRAAIARAQDGRQ
ncbi:hypothetical protein BHE74_00039915 [Ensete ventricosum]|nr:hypothetical protein BHE74_00039915 [Ensete ventricosum]RZS14709.1 hypothetical protein BHM03_00046435 [Ensete ventricosum]